MGESPARAQNGFCRPLGRLSGDSRLGGLDGHGDVRARSGVGEPFAAERDFDGARVADLGGRVAGEQRTDISAPSQAF